MISESLILYFPISMRQKHNLLYHKQETFAFQFFLLLSYDDALLPINDVIYMYSNIYCYSTTECKNRGPLLGIVLTCATVSFFKLKSEQAPFSLPLFV